MRSYWEEANVYDAVLQGVVTPGNDTNVGRKVMSHLGSWALRVRGDVWRAELLDHLGVDDLLRLMEADG